MPSFKFKLNQPVSIIVSGERSQIIGRAEYLTTENSYFLRYKSADGRAVQAWWDESALASDDPQCEKCGGTGTCRQPYSSEIGPCTECTSRPNSIAIDTTDAAEKSFGNRA